MVNTFQAQAQTTTGSGRRVIRAQINAVAWHPSARPEDQAAARRWLAGSDGTHAEKYPHLAWTPAIEQRCREQCARAFAALLGLPETAPAQKAVAQRQVDRCSICGTVVEPDDTGPCCPGARIVADAALSASVLLGLQRVTGSSLSVAQVKQVRAALSSYAVTSMDSRQRVLLAACERLLEPGIISDETALALTIPEISAVAAMTLEACRELVAGAWNSATSSLQVAS